jgi:hypothetical protein
MPIKVTIPRQELYDESTNEFKEIKETTLLLEHSLVSISKWEAKWHIPYINTKEKTEEQAFDYLRCMTITQNVNPEIYKYIPIEEAQRIKEYIEDPMTATTITKQEGKGRSNKILTSEVIYFYMFSYNIPAEFDKWHLNRLLMLIDVFNEENKPKKKMSKTQAMSRYASLNAARRARLNSAG